MRLKFTLLILVSLCLPARAEENLPLQVEHITPSPLGYQVGSVIHHQLLISVRSGWRLLTERLPGPGTLNPWLEIRRVDWHRQSMDKGKQYEVEIDYQIFPSLKQSADLAIPGFKLFFTGPQQKMQAHQLPPWHFTAAPLIPPHWRDDQVKLRPLWEPPPESISPFLQSLGESLTGALLLALFYFWRQRGLPFFTYPNPFKQALPLIKKAGTKGQVELAFKVFHGALNKTAKQALHADQITDFINTHPAFSHLEIPLNKFFHHSRQLFFEQSRPTTNYSIHELETLCRQCAKAERQCHR